MFNKVCVLMVLQLWFMMGSVFAEGITIVVSPTATVTGTSITLGQLAQISGDDTAWVESLGRLKLGNAPSPGSRVVLTKELLRIRLAATGSNFSGIVWNIPDVITVD
jgi:flagella basal body P-ring formation protein FlgA